MSDMNLISQAFAPLLGPNGSTVAVTAAVSAPTGVALPQLPDIAAGAAVCADGRLPAQQFDCFNSGSVAAALGFGNTAAAAQAAAVLPTGTPGSYTLPPGARVTLTIAGNPKYVSAIAVSSTTVVYVTPGNGK